MQDYKNKFIEFCLSKGALKFGEFTLKSGRVSPYFYNVGELMKSGECLSRLCAFYAHSLLDQGAQFDILFGPAYKGISLASVVVNKLYEHHNLDKGFCHDRKEIKDHGEGGQLVGETKLQGKKVYVIDDVITAGTAIRYAIDLINEYEGVFAGVIIGLDRQERGTNAVSAIQEIEDQYSVPVLNIINVNDILTYLKDNVDAMEDAKHYMHKISKYREEYGVE